MRYEDHPRLDQQLNVRDSTTASTNLYNARTDAGLFTDNLGQCIEPDKPGGSIGEVLDRPERTFISGTYDKAGMGRGPDLVTSAAAYVDRMYGVGATAKNTLAYNANGRTGLIKGYILTRAQADNFPSVTHRPKLLMPSRHWPMIGKQVTPYHIDIATYDLQRNGQARAIDKHLKADEKGETQHVGVVPQDNPTGLIWGRNDLRDTFDVVEDHNKYRKNNRMPLIRLTFDMPYSMSCEQDESGDFGYLKAGMDFLSDDPDVVTPWDLVISFSKSYAMASPGFYLHVTHPKYTAQFRSEGNASHGSGMNEVFARQMTEILLPKHDRAALEHFSGRRSKYAANRGVTEEIFPGMVVDGDPNIPVVVQLPENLLNRRVQSERFGGVAYDIVTTGDFVDYCAIEHDVVIVDNGNMFGRPNIRLSQSPQPEGYRRGALSVRRGHDVVMGAPAIA
jgi:aspartate/methionine/tyrosine aminotransferase